MAFPTNPTVGQLYTLGNIQYQYNGIAWDLAGSVAGNAVESITNDLAATNATVSEHYGRQLSTVASNALLNGTVATTFTATYSDADTTTADYVVDDTIQSTDSHISYKCIADADSGSSLTDTAYFEVDTTNTLILTDGVLSYTNGKDGNGYIRSAEQLSGTTTIDFAGVADGMHWVAKEKGGSYSTFKDVQNTIFPQRFRDTLWFNVINGRNYYSDGLKYEHILDILGDGSCVAAYELNGDANDIGGNYNGTINNLITVDGVYNKALKSTDDTCRVLIDACTDIKLDTTTVSFMVKYDGGDDDHQILWGTWFGGGFEGFNILHWNANSLEIHGGNDDNDWSCVSNIAIPQDGKFHQVIASHNQTTKVAKLYFDGRLIAENNDTGGGVTYTGSDADSVADDQVILFGTKDESYYGSNSIYMCQLRVFNKELNEAERELVYNEQAKNIVSKNLSVIKNPVLVASETPQYIDYNQELVTNVMDSLEVNGFNVGDFKNILSTNGYQKLPSDLIIQWGTTGKVVNNTFVDVTLPIAFPNACINAITTTYTNDVDDSTDYLNKVISISKTTLRVSSDNDSPNQFYIAMGY